MKTNWQSYALLTVIIIAVLILLAVSVFKSVPKNINYENLPGMQTVPAPWSPETSHLAERLKDIGLPALSVEGTALHIHQHIDIFINGNKVGIPEGIGISGPEGFGFISPIHTHDQSAIIHIESPIVKTFTLGQFFDIWGVRFTSDCIGGYCGGANQKLSVFSNGKLVNIEPRDLELQSHQEIVIIYGKNPENIPSSYNFPEGF